MIPRPTQTSSPLSARILHVWPKPWKPTVAPYIAPMCGRVVQASEPLRYAFVDGLSVPDSRTRPPSYNVAPSQELYVIRHNHKTGERTLDLLRWGADPAWVQGP